MNVIISNKYKQEIDALEIDVSKKLEGEFEVEELINTFSNYFFNKMILDITAIKNYQNFSILQKLSMGLNIEKIILLLDRENVNESFLSQLVSIGIYNFTTTKEGLMYLYNNPNSYRDVAQYQDSTFNFSGIENKNSDSNKIDNNKISNINSKEEYRKNITNSRITSSGGPYILGIKNMTSGAGATTLAYMMKKELCNYKDTIAIEINKKDFLFLRDPELISVEAGNLYNELSKHKDRDIILLDLNNYGDLNICNDVIYLIEPTTIKLNKMIMLDRKVFEKLQGKKIVLNKSLLDKKDISSFEMESTSTVYFNIPPLDEKIKNSEELLPFLEKLGLLDNYSTDSNSNDDKFMGMFNF